ncbi:MAG: phosphoribosylanthranilate isomerase [Lachnospiraceae bacterium]|nr:phosphoribosylanthranilate isomerase [Lachnospiraceae bacterium]
MPKIKICGLKRKEDIAYVNQWQPDFIGFVFAPSKRQITREKAVQLKGLLTVDIPVLGVFVNQSLEEMVSCVESGAVDWIQLHGDETEVVIRKLRERVKVPIVKAVRVREEADVYEADKLSCDYLLLDAFSPEAYGGTGQRFSWDMIPKDIRHPYFLAGGIDISNIEEARKTNCYAIDVSGGAETDGCKDAKKIEELVRAAHSCC